MLSGTALAQATFVCGTAACSAFGTGVITGIDNLVVGGEAYDVTFSDTTKGSPFAFSYDATSGGAPTGVAAANALDAFYATQQGPYPQADGPGILAQVQGLGVVEAFGFVTAYQATSTPGVVMADITQPFLGISLPPTLVAADAGDGTSGATSVVVSHDSSKCFAICTVWTPVSAQKAPELGTSSAIAALTLLLGGVAVLKGRRQA